MVTGDNDATARAVAAAVGIDELRAGVLPAGQGSSRAFTAEARGRRTGMVGDGVNDAPALAAADVSFAMGAGDPTSPIEAADITLMRNDLNAVVDAILLSRATLAQDPAEPLFRLRLQRARHSAGRSRASQSR